MNIFIEIPDEINSQLAGVKNVNAFIIDALKNALAAQNKTTNDDPLLSVSGILTYESDDVGSNHDFYIGNSIKND